MLVLVDVCPLMYPPFLSLVLYCYFCLSLCLSPSLSLSKFWDSGKGFTLPEVYRSGYVVIVLSILTSIAAIAYM